MTQDPTKTTHFGYRDVPEDQKAGMVHGVFTNVASKYDIMNDVMSGGIHRLWKDAMMDWLAPRSGQRLLDVAGGTGDIAFRFLKRAGAAEAVVLDMFNVIPRMGQVIAGDSDSYQYLVESIRKFPDQDRFAAMIRDAGFENVSFRNMTFGVAALHAGWKI
jgi:demethylmenaquinone methyltransferase/2-methoxy-6-polyprenyl-1,4-benzoquinol methylase